ncbi:MAG: hypothetical protein WC358_03325 [Ignavibacteria bacterium]|jgi:hypothetical protein
MYYLRNPMVAIKGEYHIGDVLDLGWEDSLIRDIEFIQADGHELNAIVKMFQGTIPIPQGLRVVRWYGDIARTIHYAMISSRGFGVFDE